MAHKFSEGQVAIVIETQAEMNEIIDKRSIA